MEVYDDENDHSDVNDGGSNIILTHHTSSDSSFPLSLLLSPPPPPIPIPVSSSRRRHSTSSILLRYFVLATMAVLITVTCPGNTQLWTTTTTITPLLNTLSTTNEENNSTNTTFIRYRIVLPIFLAYIAALIMFVIVHYSNPGVLTKDVMDHVFVVLAVVQQQQQQQQQESHNNVISITPTTTMDDDPTPTTTTIEMTRISQREESPANLQSPPPPPNGNIDDDDDDDDIVDDVEAITLPHFTTSNKLYLNHHHHPTTVKDDGPNHTRLENDNEDDTTVSLLPLVTTSPPLPRQPLQLYYCREKYCTTCQIQPLIRSHHCKICQHCVATFDHHCVFMGVCIGEGNRCQFYIFLLCQSIGFYLCTSIISTSSLGFTTILFPKISSSSSSIYLEAVRVIMAKLYVYPLTIVAYIMLGLHTFFVITNLTTFECTKGPSHLDYLQNTEETMDLPFYRGIFQNIYLCCTSDDLCHHSRTTIGSCWYGRNYRYCQRLPARPWIPILWEKPGPIVRDSPDWWNHPWKNKYWSCC